MVKGIVKKNVRIADKIYEMVLKTEENHVFVPGQFVNLYLPDKSMLLGRPISVCRLTAEELTLVYRISGKGTEQMAAFPAGEGVRLLGPLGNGYMLEEDYRGAQLALVAGGIGVPPMVCLAEELKQRGAEVFLFLGYPKEPFLTEWFEGTAEAIHIATEDGSAGFCGNAVEMLKQNGIVYDEYFSCGPKPMLAALSLYGQTISRPVQVSLEERMGCGYGACVGCTCKTKGVEEVRLQKICKDGPVFYGKDVIWNE